MESNMSLEFSVEASVYYSTDVEIDLLKVWRFTSDDLSPIGLRIIDKLLSESLGVKKQLLRTAWAAQALQEFQDLQPIIIPRKGPCLNSNYCFYEGLTTLREATLSGLNSMFHASLVMLRTSLELFMFHYWWQKRSLKDGNYRQFYDWLLSGWQGDPGLKNVIEANYKDIELPAEALGQQDLINIYKKLCAYAHKPILAESFVTIGGGNRINPTGPALYYWLEILSRFQTTILDFLIAMHPQSLFPVSLLRRFGFDYPDGVFFDHQNYLPMEGALGQRKAETYRNHYQENETVCARMSSYESLPDLPDEEILNSFDKLYINDEPYVNNDEGLSISERIRRRHAFVRAKSRTLQWAFAYLLRPHNVQWKNGCIEVQFSKEASDWWAPL